MKPTLRGYDQLCPLAVRYSGLKERKENLHETHHSLDERSITENTCWSPWRPQTENLPIGRHPVLRLPSVWTCNHRHPTTTCHEEYKQGQPLKAVCPRCKRKSLSLESKLSNKTRNKARNKTKEKIQTRSLKKNISGRKAP